MFENWSFYGTHEETYTGPDQGMNNTTLGFKEGA